MCCGIAAKSSILPTLIWLLAFRWIRAIHEIARSTMTNFRFVCFVDHFFFPTRLNRSSFT
ncbi:MAG: hypothetical protein QOH71_4322 [Blastocatellia bacterium]|nr:hypothetical protein [Blastocatellia bacterium]